MTHAPLSMVPPAAEDPAATPARCGVLLIGAGPACLFAADQLRLAGVPDVIVVEKGKPMPARTCPADAACECPLCDVLEGEGGAGSFSDGKITLSATRGTHGKQLFGGPQEELLAEVEATVRAFAPGGISYPPVPALTALTGHEESGLRFESYPLLHVGSDGIRRFGEGYSAFLRNNGVRILTGVEARELLVDGGHAAGAVLYERRSRRTWPLHADTVVVGAGLVGTAWLENQLRAHGIALATGPADIGIRLETSAAALEPFIGEFYDFKITQTSSAGLTVRSFCVNGNGFIVSEYHRPLGIRAVNGHSFLDRRSGRSNLAILATIDQSVTADPKGYVRQVARDVNAAAAGYPGRQNLAGFLPNGSTGPPLGVQGSNPQDPASPVTPTAPASAVRGVRRLHPRARRCAPPGPRRRHAHLRTGDQVLQLPSAGEPADLGMHRDHRSVRRRERRRLHRQPVRRRTRRDHRRPCHRRPPRRRPLTGTALRPAGGQHRAA